MNDTLEDLLQDAYRDDRDRTPTEGEVMRVMHRHTRREPRLKRLRSRLAVVGLSLAVGVAIVPATRAAVTDFGGWLFGTSSEAPGRPLRADDHAPEWITTKPGEKRLVAEAGGAKLVIARDEEQFFLAVGEGYGESGPAENWRSRIADTKILFVGLGTFPGDEALDEQDRRALMGLTASNVRTVELHYTEGEPTVARGVDGGFVLLADAHRRPRVLIGYDAQGRVVGQVDASTIDLRVCRFARGCPPGRFQP